jgi:hypothetical protein
VDDDNDVDIFDIQLVAACFGTVAGDGDYDSNYDVDCDGDIDILDIQKVSGRWGIDSDDPEWAECPLSMCVAPTIAAASVSLRFLQGKTHLDKSITILVQIEDIVDLGAMEFRFRPQEGLIVKNIKIGEFLSQTGNTVIPLKSEVSASGEINSGIISFGKHEGVSGNGVLAQIELEVQSDKALHFVQRQACLLSDVKLADKKGNQLSAEVQRFLIIPVIPPPPKVSSLLANYPNPFNPETWIPYQLSEAVETVISIYDVSGRLIRKFDLGYKEAGFYLNKSSALHWDGTNELGESVASGMYFYQLRLGNNFTGIRKMLILK